MWAIVLFVVPYLISLLISFGVGVYSWRHRSEAGARAYAVVAFSQALWTAGYICELLSPDLAGKLFWDNFQWIAGVGWSAGLLFFIYDYTHLHWPHGRLILSLLVMPLLLLPLLAYTDSWHHLVHINLTLVPVDPYPALNYDFAPLVWMLALYAYLLFLGALLWLLIKYVRAHSLYRHQVGFVILGNVIPLAGTVLTLTGVVAGPYRDLTPYSFALGNIIVAWGLFRYHLFDLVPIARDALIESMTDAVFVLDVANRLVDLNSAACRAIGVTSLAAIGQPAERLFARWPGILNQYLNVEQAQAEIEVASDHDQVFLDLKIQSVYNRRGQLTSRLIQARDVSDRHRAQAELQARTAQLEEANDRLQVLSRAKDEFVSNVSHELRTPINNLKLNLSLLTRRPERGPILLQTLQRETDRLSYMIDGLLMLSRLDQNQIELVFAAFELNSLIEEYVIDRQLLAANQGLTLTCETLSDSLLVMGERNLIGQVLSILLTNAMNYTPAGGDVIVTVQYRSAERRAGFSVADTGPGISPQENARLFTRFFRGEAGHSSKIAGTGLGLALAKEIIDRHHGQIYMDSTSVPGQGATFTVWLPLTEGA
jgi:PAS domain S-box-containing protein